MVRPLFYPADLHRRKRIEWEEILAVLLSAKRIRSDCFEPLDNKKYISTEWTINKLGRKQFFIRTALL